MKNTAHCPMIHGGLNIDLKANNGKLSYNQCCLSTTNLEFPDDVSTLWDSEFLRNFREQNDNNIWQPGCWQCKNLENSGVRSFRQAMTDQLGITKNLSGPQRIDLLFDRSCNLACRSCSPAASTFWAKHLRDNNLPVIEYSNSSNLEIVINTLKSLDLTNLKVVQFCGGETLLGNTYWEAAKVIAESIPNAKDTIDVAFQTNGTQSIDEKYYKIIEKFRLVKFIISMDGTHDRFEYMRWPARWNQMIDNIMTFRENLPVNVMFLFQETISCLNLFYHNEVPGWITQNFKTNRLGDTVDYALQLVIHQNLDVNNITQEYVDSIRKTNIKNVLNTDWVENPEKIKQLLLELEKFDVIRNQNWKKTFPEVAEFYSRYL